MMPVKVERRFEVDAERAIQADWIESCTRRDNSDAAGFFRGSFCRVRLAETVIRTLTLF